eukprot:scaffold62150_cov19-Tisochrysis_lutea.AAC.2
MGEVSSSSSSSRFWVLAITGSAAAAGLGYLAYTYLQGGSKEVGAILPCHAELAWHALGNICSSCGS